MGVCMSGAHSENPQEPSDKPRLLGSVPRESNLKFGSIIAHGRLASPPDMCCWAHSTPVQILNQRGDQAASRVAANFGTTYCDELSRFMAMESDSGNDFQCFYAQDSVDELQEMAFWREGTSRVYRYIGLEKKSAANVETKIDASTAIGVLMLDEYAIQNRVGDPSNPLTFWPYPVFYAIPLGISFAICKEVGASQGKGGTAKYVEVICNALNKLAQTAGEDGFSNLYITGDCGYYSLAISAYNEALQKMQWSLLPGTVACQVHSFRVPVNSGRQALTVHLALGTPQMIADPIHSIANCLDNAAILYATADLNGWYTGNSETSKTIANELKIAYKANHFAVDNDNGSEWWRANDGVCWGFFLAEQQEWAGMIWNDVALKLTEYKDMMSFLVGMYIGYRSWEPGYCIDNAMNKAAEVAEHVLHELESNQESFIDWLLNGLCSLDMLDCCQSCATEGGSAVPSRQTLRNVWEENGCIDHLGVLKAVVAVVGGVPDFEGEMRYLQEHVRDKAVKLLQKPAFQDGLVDVDDNKFYYPVGWRYIEWYARFVHYVNVEILKNNQGDGNLFDAHKLYLFDVRYVPAFGAAVAKGATVWSYAQNYFWINAIFGRFAEVVQQSRPSVALAYHLECTELLTFLDMLQIQGVSVIGNVSYLYLASLGNNSPLKFQRYPLQEAPAAPLCLYVKNSTPQARWFRRKQVPIRTTDLDASAYLTYRGVMYPPGAKTSAKMTWSQLVKAGCLFGSKELDPNPRAQSQVSDGIHVCSTQLPVNYFPNGGWIQYAGKTPFFRA